jgi:hypothetical protein
LCRSTISIISAKKSFSSVHRLVGRARAGHGGKAADVEEQHAHGAALAPQLGIEQLFHHHRRDMLAEQVGDLVARRAAATEFSNCWRRRGRRPRGDAASISMMLRLKW